jgi:hypothetical protein
MKQEKLSARCPLECTKCRNVSVIEQGLRFLVTEGLDHENSI